MCGTAPEPVTRAREAQRCATGHARRVTRGARSVRPPWQGRGGGHGQQPGGHPVTTPFRHGSVLLMLFMMGLLSGCGGSPEHELARAQLALQAGQGQKALALVTRVLAEKPDHLEARLVKARAQLILTRLDDAGQTLEALLASHPENVDVRRAVLEWSFRRMTEALARSGFATDEAHRASFEAAVEVAGRHIDWLMQQTEHEAQAYYIRARLAQTRSAALQLRMQALRGGDGDDGGTTLTSLELDRNTLMRRAEDDLRAALDRRPQLHNARAMFGQLLAIRQDWPAVWALCRQTADLDEITLPVADSLATALFVMPDSFQPAQVRRDLAWDILNAVPEPARVADSWCCAAARLYLEQGRPEDADGLLDTVLARSPAHVNARYLKARSHYESGRYEQAKVMLGQLVTGTGVTDGILVAYGLTLMQTEDPGLARDAFKRALDLNPDNVMARQAYMRLVASSQSLDAIGEDIIRYYMAHRSDPEAIRWMVQYLHEGRRVEELRRRLGEVELLRPLLPEHLAVLVDGYRYVGDLAGAERSARRLIDARPDEPGPRLALARVMIAGGKHAEVEPMLQALSERFPDAPQADELLGIVQLQSGAVDRAVASLQRVIDGEDPGHVNHAARLRLAGALAALALPEEALAHVDAILMERPDDLDARALAARICQVMGDAERVRDYLGSIEPAAIDEKRRPALLAQLLMARDDLDAAAEVCSRAIGAGDRDMTLCWLLARIAVAREQHDEAHMQLRSMVRDHPDDARAYMALAQMYIERGALDEGLAEFEALEQSNAPQALMGRALLLAAADRPSEAVATLDGIYRPLVARGLRRALSLADAIARIQLQRGDHDAAHAIYDPLIEKGVRSAEARLRQIDLRVRRGDVDTAVSWLGELAGNLGATQQAMRLAVVRRYERLGRWEQALALVDRCVADRGESAGLLGRRARLLRLANRAAEAITAYGRAIELVPRSPALHQGLAWAHLSAYDYPAAEKVYERMARLGPRAKMASLAYRAEMFLRIGLDQPARTALAELEVVGRPHDPRVDFVVGQGHAGLGDGDKAALYLSAIPGYAPQYPAAQLMLARLEQGRGDVDAAKQRLRDLVGRRDAAAAATRELLALDLRSRDEEALLGWADDELKADALPDGLRGRWLQVKAWVRARQADWPAVLATLSNLAALWPDATPMDAGRVVLLTHLGRHEEAAEAYRTSSALASARVGPLCAVLVGETPGEVEMESAASRFLRAVIIGDGEAARAAAEALPPLKTMYASDLLALLEREDIGSPPAIEAARRVALALVALDVGLVPLAEEVAAGVVAEAPWLVPAWGVLLQARSRADEGPKAAARTAEQVRTALPGSALGLFLAARAKQSSRDWAGAAADLETLSRREPDHAGVAYDLAESWRLAGRIDDAIGLLGRLAADPGAFRVPALNSLAYVLAEQRPDRLAEALELAERAREAAPADPAVRDTLGWVAHLRGDEALSAEHLRAAIAHLGRVAVVHEHLAAVYEAVGDTTWARRHRDAAATHAATSGSGPE